MVDFAFPILEQFGDRLQDLEDEVLQRPGPGTIQEIHRIKRELLLVRRAMWPADIPARLSAHAPSASPPEERHHPMA